ncbi:DUF1054 domain-containing protein [Paenalkalicoccus suaedae]|uniref:UPF0637 protein FLK61_33295 n=1 Tax=Paenalkalicoccus suaedae TaxID=2592382 RepID=A0A859FEQ7_9BACI|nr:DUF1054 domain-containing protein [Paenalkalicoccus suaedae]QKS71567.1 DUF1054 domain-containing protein [Paenalkalicoccus suaedae]
MTFTGFTQKDFDVFSVEGLDERMEALKEEVRPKLEGLGEHFKGFLTEATGQDMYYHVAKHARRKVNPPNDTWVAFCNNNRGYKKLPHFQIGLFGSHVFVWFAVIYESPVKGELGQAFLRDQEEIAKQIPTSFVWSEDHMKPTVMPHSSMEQEDLERLFTRLSTIKKAEMLCGMTFDYNDPILKDGNAFISKVEDVFSTLMPMYKSSMALYEQTV